MQLYAAWESTEVLARGPRTDPEHITLRSATGQPEGQTLHHALRVQFTETQDAVVVARTSATTGSGCYCGKQSSEVGRWCWLHKLGVGFMPQPRGGKTQ